MGRPDESSSFSVLRRNSTASSIAIYLEDKPTSVYFRTFARRHLCSFLEISYWQRHSGIWPRIANKEERLSFACSFH
eukprot:scaffold22709_cov158-Cylindrotheca_fusiformis.AAC.2